MFLFGPKPQVTAQYIARQELAYISAVLLGTLQLITGIVINKPTQFSADGVEDVTNLHQPATRYERCKIRNHRHGSELHLQETT